MQIKELSANEAEDHLPLLAQLLYDCVEDGASVSFVQPFSLSEAKAFWSRKVFPAMAGGGRKLFVAIHGDALLGSVQLDIDTPPNQPHRAEVAKLLVNPAHRRKGIAQRLMDKLHTNARELRRTLITLDTRTGDKAEPLYLKLGYTVAGVIPNYARDPKEDRLDSTTYMFKLL